VQPISWTGKSIMETNPDRQPDRPLHALPGSQGAGNGCDRSGWNAIRTELEQSAPSCGLNLAHAAVTRHACGPTGDRPALRWLGDDPGPRELSFAGLERLTNRAANGFRDLGLLPGQVVATLCGREPELYLSALGALKAGAVFCALYASYGPEPIIHRLNASRAAMLVTNRRLYEKIRDARHRLPDLAHVLLIDARAPHEPEVAGLQEVLDAADEDFTIPPTDPESPALIHFTSGTTGMPKGVVHVHAAALHHLLTARDVLDLKDTERYWCTADPGWVTGVVYGFLAPLMAGATTLVDTEEFDVRRWLQVLSGERVTVWYTSPSALRRLMPLPFSPREQYDLKSLRLVFSVGEPLDARVVAWGSDALGVPIRDTWWQTETGGIMIANHAGEPVRPGAMGRPVNGIEANVVRPTAGGGFTRCGIGEVGEIAIAAGWPSMFRGLLGDADAYRQRFVGRWYMSGDLVRRNADGTFRFVGRADDMIKTAGYLVSPFEVESVLLGYPGVVEAGVVGIPDEHLGQRVRACLALAPGIVGDDHLSRQIMAFARQHLGPALAPREIRIIPDMPKNRAGKIVRRDLATPDAPAEPGMEPS
jgi:acetyl-CoA synthetase